MPPERQGIAGDLHAEAHVRQPIRGRHAAATANGSAASAGRDFLHDEETALPIRQEVDEG